jgi:cell division transport system permease protein
MGMIEPHLRSSEASVAGLWERVPAVRACLVAVLLVPLTVGLVGCASKPTPSTPRDPVEMAVFLRSDVTEPQKRTIEARLRAIPEANKIVFETRDQAYARFREEFKDAPALVETTRLESFSDAFRLELADGAAAESISTELRRMPGVDDVSTAPKTSASRPATSTTLD